MALFISHNSVPYKKAFQLGNGDAGVILYIVLWCLRQILYTFLTCE